ncbi:MAG TPA: 1-acyl-sn-glycerol-3-phosphate acyltransferase [Candidatus Saccharimonadales bacterium]|nr:1-acyl-sn-glycerol-3-phosphate acyltransferase [Candidatus Saccharimonadales bacterium]
MSKSKGLEVSRPWVYDLASRPVGGALHLAGGLEVTGASNIRDVEKAMALFSNHDYFFDPIVNGKAFQIVHPERRLHSPAKIELWDNPLMAAFLNSVGAFKVLRGTAVTAQPKVQAHFMHLLENDADTQIFPTTTRQNHDKRDIPLRKLHSSTALLFVKYGGVIVPTGVIAELFPQVHFAEPIDIPREGFDINNRDEVADVHKRVLKPLFRNEIQPRMQDAIDVAARRRQLRMKYTMPTNLLQRLILNKAIADEFRAGHPMLTS